jgi:hypothetical protein
MNWDYIFDGADPRGVEYAATRRAARGARETQQNTADLLALELARAEGNEMYAYEAARIRARQSSRSARRSFWRVLDVIAAGAAIAFLIWCFAPASNAPQSAVTHDTPASVSQAPRDVTARTSPAQAPHSRKHHYTDAERRANWDALCVEVGLEKDCDGL